MDIEEAPGCTYDALYVYDGSEFDNVLIICGSEPPEPILSSTNELELIFSSDDSESGAGFSLQYEILDESSGKDSLFHDSTDKPG